MRQDDGLVPVTGAVEEMRAAGVEMLQPWVKERRDLKVEENGAPDPKEPKARAKDRVGPAEEHTTNGIARVTKEVLKAIRALKEEARQASGYHTAEARVEPTRCRAETDGNGWKVTWARRTR